MTPEEFNAVMKVHVYGAFNCTKPAAILMRQQRSGRVISMSSGSGLTGNTGQANYGAAKAGIAGFTRVVARDLGRYGITVNCIAPGAATRMTSTVPDSARDRRAAVGIQSVARSADTDMRHPDNVAPIVVWLCTDAAANVNGQTFGASGGKIALHYQPVEAKSILKQERWTLDELDAVLPGSLLVGLMNPAPVQPPKA